uniref:Ribosomal protein S3 n=1 Tax=Gloeochaete wittrockiana TaxID=38269 RepID=A0A096Y6Q6_9EUKA|nr:ribosomal protein S3 [Gloeochaete wittrockiana]AIM52008.1 ribosomal protein S3 [Gloeochaete wittrockiana]
MGQKTNPLILRCNTVNILPYVLTPNKDKNINFSYSLIKYYILLNTIKNTLNTRLTKVVETQLFDCINFTIFNVMLHNNKPKIYKTQKKELIHLKQILHNKLSIINGKAIFFNFIYIPELIYLGNLMFGQMQINLKKTARYKPLIYKIEKKLKKIPFILGYKFEFSGRLNYNDIAKTEFIKYNKMPLHTFEENILYNYRYVTTKKGCIGMKIWLCTRTKSDKN